MVVGIFKAITRQVAVKLESIIRGDLKHLNQGFL